MNNIRYYKYIDGENFYYYKVENHLFYIWTKTLTRWDLHGNENNYTEFLENQCASMTEEAAQIFNNEPPTNIKENKNEIPIYFKVKNQLESIRLYRISHGKIHYWKDKTAWTFLRGAMKNEEKDNSFFKCDCQRVNEIQAAKVEPKAFGLESKKEIKLHDLKKKLTDAEKALQLAKDVDDLTKRIDNLENVLKMF